MHALLRHPGNAEASAGFRYSAQPQLPKLPNRLRFFFASLKKKPFVLSTHGSLLGYKKYLPSFLHKLPYHLYDALTLKSAALKADAVVVSSRMEFADALEFGISREKLHVIPMGIDVDACADSSRRTDEGPLKILFVGRIARVRRIELILRSVSLLSCPWTLTLVGGEEKTSSLTRGGYLRELQALCDDLGIRDRVTFAGAKAPATLPEFYQSADLFVYPSLYENFSQPVLEAAAWGLPIIATAVGIVPEVVKEGESGFIVSGNPEEIANRIQQLSNPNVRAEFGRHSRENVRRQFGWDQIMRQYVELYRSL